MAATPSRLDAIERILDLVGVADERRPLGRVNLGRLSEAELSRMAEQAEADAAAVSEAVARWTRDP